MASPDQPQVTEAILSILGKGSKALPAGSSLGVQRCAMAHEGTDMPLALVGQGRDGTRHVDLTLGMNSAHASFWTHAFQYTYMR